MKTLRPPIVLASHFCDDVALGNANKFNLIGLFSRIEVGVFPYIHPRLCVFVVMTDGRGTVDLVAALRHLESGEVIWREESKMIWVDPTEQALYVRSLSLLRFPHPGHYTLELSDGNEAFYTRTLKVYQAPTQFELKDVKL